MNSSSLPMMGSQTEPTIFELSKKGRNRVSLPPRPPELEKLELNIPNHLLRENDLDLVEISERDVISHFTRLSHRQYSIDLGFYPLGSCTMKYNPKLCDIVASNEDLTSVHPSAPEEFVQGWLEIFYRLGNALAELTGLPSVSLQPAAGAAGELTGLLIIKAYHQSKGSNPRKILIPDSAHGTNPASVTLAGYEVLTVGTNNKGTIDLDDLKSKISDDIAGIMLTNPNTLGIFEIDIREIADLLHQKDALLYYDGANLNAIVGRFRPGDMGFDITHLNLHKTFATPHGGGGPGSGPVCVSDKLASFLPGPIVRKDKEAKFRLALPENSIGRIHSYFGNAMVLARALSYVIFNGIDGLRNVSQIAVLNANYVKELLKDHFDLTYSSPVMHEVVVSAKTIKRDTGVKTLDIAKALLDRGFHAPTVYFPLLIEEALMIEPTETESLESIEDFCKTMIEIANECYRDPEQVKAAPVNTPVKRVDEARAARDLKVTF